jgi:predicted ribonuclease YlaK
LASAKAANRDLRRQVPPIHRDQLNDEQKLAHDAFVDGPPGIHLLLGEAGKGKTVVISVIKTTLAE